MLLEEHSFIWMVFFQHFFYDSIISVTQQKCLWQTLFLSKVSKNLEAEDFEHKPNISIRYLIRLFMFSSSAYRNNTTPRH